MVRCCLKKHQSLHSSCPRHCWLNRSCSTIHCPSFVFHARQYLVLMLPCWTFPKRDQQQLDRARVALEASLLSLHLQVSRLNEWTRTERLPYSASQKPPILELQRCPRIILPTKVLERQPISGLKGPLFLLHRRPLAELICVDLDFVMWVEAGDFETQAMPLVRLRSPNGHTPSALQPFCAYPEFGLVLIHLPSLEHANNQRAWANPVRHFLCQRCGCWHD